MNTLCHSSELKDSANRTACPSVSVVIPTCNAGPLVTQAIDSVLAQTVAPCQIIVVDDGSTDDTASRLARYGERITCVRQSRSGPSVARNRGVGLAVGQWVAFLDADDVWQPRKLELQLKALAYHSDAGVIGAGNFTIPASTFPKVGDVSEDSVRTCRWEGLIINCYFATSSVLIRRDLLNEVGLFDPDLPGSEDRDLWCRLSERAKVVYLDLLLVGMTNTHGSLSKNAALMMTGGLKRLEKIDARHKWPSRLIRREAYSCLYFSCCNIYATQGEPIPALRCLARSLLWYPLPCRVRHIPSRFFRMKTLAVLLLRLAHLKKN